MATHQEETSQDDGFRVRPMRKEDIPVLQAIDRRILNRATSWDNVDLYLAGQPLLSFVAECDDLLVGFLLGDVKSYEFGLPESGWIETVGVDPAYQKRGVGRRLVKVFVEHCQRIGVASVQTLLKRNDDDTRTFLERLDFKRGELINMEKLL